MYSRCKNKIHNINRHLILRISFPHFYLMSEKQNKEEAYLGTSIYLNYVGQNYDKLSTVNTELQNISTIKSMKLINMEFMIPFWEVKIIIVCRIR